MRHVDPFAPADSPLHPANLHRTTHQTMEAEMAGRQELAGHRDNPPHDPPAAPEGDDAQTDPPQADKPARRRRKKATPEELEAARQAALARLDGRQ